MAKSKSLPEPVSDDSWKHEDDARTLVSAHEIMNDPERMKHVKKHLNKKKNAMKSLSDVIKYRNDKYGGSSPQNDAANDGDGDE